MKDLRIIQAVLRVLVIPALLLSLGSCDDFLLAPTGRIQHHDPEAGFSRLEPQMIGDEVRLVWDWYDLERDLRDGTVNHDQIILKHKTGSYPDSRFDGVFYHIDDWDPVEKPMSSVVFEDLQHDREHYFALYAHEKGGRWLAPVYSRIHLGGYESWTTDPPVTPIDFFSGDTSVSGTTGAAGPISDTEVSLYYYDQYDEDNVSSALLSFDVTTAPAADETILIYPMRQYWPSGSNPYNLNTNESEGFYIDRTIRAEIPVDAGYSGSLTDIDITEVFAKALFHQTNGILIMTDGSGGMNISIPELILDLVWSIENGV